MTSMYRLRSHIDESLDIGFDDYSDMERHVTENNISASDATMQEWVDDRINPEQSGYRDMEG